MPLDALLCPKQILGAKPALRDLTDLLARDLEARPEVVLARSDVDADLARVGVLRREAVDGVGHAPLLADLLEEPRGRRAPEDAVEQRGREAPLVRACDSRRGDAHVVLLGVLALEAQARRSEEDTSELQSRFGISYAVFSLI